MDSSLAERAFKRVLDNFKDFGSFVKSENSHLELNKLNKQNDQQIITLLTRWTKNDGEFGR